MRCGPAVWRGPAVTGTLGGGTGVFLVTLGGMAVVMGTLGSWTACGATLGDAGVLLLGWEVVA
jgi:hypothetical protein